MSLLETFFGKTAGLSHSSLARVIEPLLENNVIIEKKLGKQIRLSC